MPTASELRDLTTAEIETRLEETKEELFNLRFQNATGQLDNYRRLGLLRRDIARIHTILRQRQLEEAHQGGGER
jgi:large subunit ribosomal protein L29